MSALGQDAPAEPSRSRTGRGSAAIVVTRSRRSSWWAGASAVVLVGVLAYLPYQVYSDTTNLLVDFFQLLIMASMWNLLAGYAGLVSVGQQAFIGLGAYFVVMLANQGVSPFSAIPLATILTGLAGVVVWWLVSRLRAGYFAISMWVIASVCMLIITQISSLGTGPGMARRGLPLDPTLLSADTLIHTWDLARGAGPDERGFPAGPGGSRAR